MISLMNDLKTKFQERMGHEYLRDLVWWHKSKWLLSHAEGDVTQHSLPIVSVNYAIDPRDSRSLPNHGQV